MQIRELIRFESSKVPAFGEIVRSQLKKRVNAEIYQGYPCQKCHRSFLIEWELTRHQSTCQPAGRSHARLQINGSYSCLICAHESANLDDAKKHLFYNHSEVDVLAKYGLPFQRVIGDKMHTRLRVPMFTRIAKGKFDRAIQIIVEKIDNFDINSLDRTFPLMVDDDLINKQRRKLVYKQKRDILTKIATMSKEASLTILTDSDDEGSRDKENQLIWDLSLNLDREWIPDEIIRCIRWVVYALKQKLSHVPCFQEFYKDGCMVMLKFSHLPLRLRNIIGKRSEMYQKGPKIVK
jgi:hypothetical protein